MSEAKILACPFCGGDVSTTGKIKYCDSHTAWWKDGTRVLEAYFCNCMSCGITNQGLLGHQTQQLAIQHWNKRAGGRKSAVSKTPGESTLASATGYAAERDASERWMREVTDLLCYQPDIPMEHKTSLVDAFANYRKVIGRPLRD